jgi:AcrR family transcriptional regulator
MVARAKRVYGGESAADRQAGRRDGLLDAGLEVFGGAGDAAPTVRAVCAEAKLTTRYFYESFDDLDALRIAVFERVVGEAAQAILAALETASDDARDRAHAVIEAFVVNLTDDPRRARVAFTAGAGNPELEQRRIATVRMFSRLTAQEGGAFYGAPEPDAPDPVVELTASLLVGGLAHLMLSWLDGQLAVEREQLVDYCAEIFVVTGARAAEIAAERRA